MVNARILQTAMMDLRKLDKSVTYHANIKDKGSISTVKHLHKRGVKAVLHIPHSLGEECVRDLNATKLPTIFNSGVPDYYMGLEKGILSYDLSHTTLDDIESSYDHYKKVSLMINQYPPGVEIAIGEIPPASDLATKIVDRFFKHDVWSQFYLHLIQRINCIRASGVFVDYRYLTYDLEHSAYFKKGGSPVELSAISRPEPCRACAVFGICGKIDVNDETECGKLREFYTPLVHRILRTV